MSSTSDIIILIVTLVVVTSVFAYNVIRYRMDEGKAEQDVNKE